MDTTLSTYASKEIVLAANDQSGNRGEVNAARERTVSTACYDHAQMTSPPARTQVELVVFGEFFFDLVFYQLPRAPKFGEEVKTRHFAEYPGGGLATTALTAARLGTSTAVVTRVGADARRNPAWQALVGSRIFAGACEFSSKFPTAMTVCAAYGGDRMMITHDAINRNLDTLLRQTGVRRQFPKARHLHLACAPYPLDRWISPIRELRAQGLTISLDIGWNPEVLRSPKLSAMVRHCDFVFPNALEARAMTGEKTVDQAARKLAQQVRVPIVKLGREGSIAVQDHRLLRAKSVPVRVVDATGAGDAFNGGFLHAYLSGWSTEDCLRAGNICGAMAATRPGGSAALLSRRRLREFMKRI
jgi:ribokinase